MGFSFWYIFELNDSLGDTLTIFNVKILAHSTTFYSTHVLSVNIFVFHSKFLAQLSFPNFLLFFPEHLFIIPKILIFGIPIVFFFSCRNLNKLSIKYQSMTYYIYSRPWPILFKVARNWCISTRNMLVTTFFTYIYIYNYIYVYNTVAHCLYFTANILPLFSLVSTVIFKILWYFDFRFNSFFILFISFLSKCVNFTHYLLGSFIGALTFVHLRFCCTCLLDFVVQVY